MKVETLLFASGTFFFAPLGLMYGFLTRWSEPVGVVGFVLLAGLAAMVGGYLAVTARRIDPRPEDDPQGEIDQGAGELGMFPPHSWWPLPLGFAAAVAFLGLAVGWWVFYIGAGIALVALVGWVYEYYRGAHAH